MSYTNNNGVTESTPVGASTPANTIDTEIQDVKKAYNERLDDVFGVDWETDAPIIPTKLGPSINISGDQPYTDIFDAGDSGTAKTIDWDDGDQQKVALTGNCTFTFSNVKVGATYVLYLVQDGTGGRTITLPAACKQYTAAFSTAGLILTASTLTILTLTVYNSLTISTSAQTTGTSVS